MDQDSLQREVRGYLDIGRLKEEGIKDKGKQVKCESEAMAHTVEQRNDSSKGSLRHRRVQVQVHDSFMTASPVATTPFTILSRL